MYNLKTYLRNVYELEASVYQQEACIRNIQSEISRLPSVRPAEPRSSVSPGMFLMGLGMIAGAVILFMQLNFLAIVGALMLGYVGGLLALGGTTVIFGDLSDNSKQKKAYPALLARYENGQTIKRALEADLPALRNKLSETQNLLHSYYSKGVLHPKYRNFVAVAYLLDCIDTGRYTKLDGPDGAYNQFELEVRMDRISSQLDTVINKLDQIRQNQYSLYAAITQANRTNQMMFQKLDGYCRNLDTLNANAAQIRQSLNTANHTAELTRKEIAYRNYLDRGSSYSY